MRVLFCTLDYPPSPAGGAEQQARLQAQALLRLGHHVEVVCPRTPGYRSGFVDGVRVHRLPIVARRRLRTATYAGVLAAFLLARLRKFDLVHVHLANLQADVAVAVAELIGRPSYVKLAAGGPLGEIARFRRVAKVTRRYGLRHATVIQAISDEIAEDAIAAGVPAARIRRIPNGVRIRPMSRDPAHRIATRGRLELPPDALVVLFSGRLERDKGVGDLLAAWRQWNPASATLILLGSTGVKDPVSLNDLPRRAIHRPWSADVAGYLEAADVFVLPSHAEGMSNALLEAMSAGIACVATRVGAAEELIGDDANGLLIDVGDIAGLEASLVRLAGDSNARERLGSAARQKIIRSYSIDSVVRRIEAEYEAAVAGQ